MIKIRSHKSNKPFQKKKSPARKSPFWIQYLKTSSVFLMSAALLFPISCGEHKSKQPLRIAVSANVQFAMKEIEEVFEKQTGIEIEYSTGSSGKLTAQIQNKAPYHVFLAANMKYPQALIESKDASGEVRVYAMGDVVAWTNKESVDIDRWTKIATSQAIQKIALPNPRNAPYGIATVNCLKKLNLYNSLEPKLVLGENISQANQFIVSKSVDFGFTSKSVVVSSEMKDTGKWSELPEGCYQPIEQGVIQTITGFKEKKEESEAFLRFLFTPEAKEIFHRYGYRTKETLPE